MLVGLELSLYKPRLIAMLAIWVMVCAITIVNIGLASIAVSIILLLGMISMMSLMASGMYFTTATLFLIVFACSVLRLIEYIIYNLGRCITVLATFLIISSFISINVMLGLLEFVSILFRSLSLGLRFLANSLAGHILVHLIFMCGIGLFMASSLLIFSGLLLLFECIISVIQITVFAILILTYAGEVLFISVDTGRSSRYSRHVMVGLCKSGLISSRFLPKCRLLRYIHSYRSWLCYFCTIYS